MPIGDPKPYDEAQRYADGMRALRASGGLISHPVLLAELAKIAIEIRRRLDLGQRVRILADEEELVKW